MKTTLFKTLITFLSSFPPLPRGPEDRERVAASGTLAGVATTCEGVRARRGRSAGWREGGFGAALLFLFFPMATCSFNAANFVTILGCGQEMSPSVSITTGKVRTWSDGRCTFAIGAGAVNAAPARPMRAISLLALGFARQFACLQVRFPTAHRGPSQMKKDHCCWL